MKPAALPIGRIKVGKRHRRDMGDIEFARRQHQQADRHADQSNDRLACADQHHRSKQ